jgi:hypothetical protein
MGLAVSLQETFPLTSWAEQISETKKRGGTSVEMMRGITFAMSLLFMLASACGEKPASLEERVTAYWQARRQGQVEKAFEFEVPGSIEKSAYLKWILTSPISFTTSSITSIDEQGDEATVNLQMQYLLPGLTKSVSSSMAEKWIKIRGQWYRQPREQGERVSGANMERR